MEESIRFAKKYTEDMLSFFGVNTDVRATHEEDVIEISVPSTYLNGFLIGHNGETLRSMQYLISAALKGAGHEYNRVNLDIADYKKQRNERLAAEVERWAHDVKTSGKEMSLQPMNPADRRIVHKTISEIGGLTTRSDGEARDRHVVIEPAPLDASDEADEAEEADEVVETKTETNVKPKKETKAKAKSKAKTKAKAKPKKK